MSGAYFTIWLCLTALVQGHAIAGGEQAGGHEHEKPAHTHADMETMHHTHDRWLDPPPEYANSVNHDWADLNAIARGKTLYEAHCAACHGTDGQGAGPLARSLGHPPADLTNNFHTSPGNGDAYLFWRVSEGGLAEPFRAQGSAMPAFKDVLTEQQRWDVLTYVHTFFHHGLARWQKGEQ